jgi:hypothetical protein
MANISTRDYITFTHYLVATDQGRWGRGETMREAIENAAALNIKTGKIRKDVKVMAWLNIQSQSDCLTEDRVKALESDRHFGVTGYKPGEYMKPWIDCYGSPRYYGLLKELDLF